MASATFTKPAMLAPTTRLPGCPYSSAVSQEFLKILDMIWRNREYYASGAAEKELIAGADVAALQKLVTDSAMSFVKE